MVCSAMLQAVAPAQYQMHMDWDEALGASKQHHDPEATAASEAGTIFTPSSPSYLAMSSSSAGSCDLTAPNSRASAITILDDDADISPARDTSPFEGSELDSPGLRRTQTRTWYNEDSSLEWQGVPMLQVPFSPGVASAVTSQASAAASAAPCDGFLGSTCSKDWMRIGKRLRGINRREAGAEGVERVDKPEAQELVGGELSIEEIAAAKGYVAQDQDTIKSKSEPVSSDESAPRISDRWADLCGSDDEDENPTASTIAVAVPTAGPSMWSSSSVDATYFPAQGGQLHVPMGWIPVIVVQPMDNTEFVGGDSVLLDDDVVLSHEHESIADGSGGVLSMIELAQMRAEMRAQQEQLEGGAGTGARRRRRGGKNRTSSSRFGSTLRMTTAELSSALQSEQDEDRQSALLAIRGCVPRLSMEATGCRVVQVALEVADRKISIELALELQGHVKEAIESPHGNYVIQKVVEVLPAANSYFIAEELMGTAAEVARHRYGCRIMCRLLEQSGQTSSTAALVDEALAEADSLARHSFGHHVIESALQNSPVWQQRRIIEALNSNLPRNAWNRNAAMVIEKVLTTCANEEQRLLLEGFARCDPELLASLARSRLGTHITRAIARMPPGALGLKALGGLRLAAGRGTTARVPGGRVEFEAVEVAA